VGKNLEAALFTTDAPDPCSIQVLDDHAQVALAKARRIEGWYQGAKGKKRVGAIVTRLGAIAMGVAATVVPTVLTMVAGVRDGSFLQRWVPISGVLAVTAALLVVIDKFAGYSTGWMRYIAADQEIRSRHEQFELTWAKTRAELTDPVPLEKLTTAVDLIAGFVAMINEVVKQETQAWIAEFKGVLADLDKTATEARTQALAAAGAAPRRGALEVVVVGLARLDQQTWQLQVGEGGPPVTYVGAASAAFVDLVPGAVKLRFVGAINALPWLVEKAAQVEAGKTTQVKVAADPVTQ
jgi:hypothetical protein